MSYDLQVLAKRQPKAADLTAFVEAAGTALESAGTFKRGGSILLRDQHGAAAEIDGPNRIEAEDLPETAVGWWRSR
jgi:hypothetical protein